MTHPYPTTHPTDAPASEALLSRARAVTPGGVNSPVRAFRAVGGTPRFMASGRGPWLTDVDGRDYVDLVCSWGPMILGHAAPAVLDAVLDAAGRGFSFGTPSENEVLLAEEIVARVAPVEQVRLVSSGTEATMSAIRLARGFTGRSLVVKFAGHYHGHVDSLLVSAGSGVATLALPDSAGVPAEIAAETLVVPYNDVAALEAVFAAHGERIACVVTEAAAGNMGVVPPDPGFTEALRRVTDRARGAPRVRRGHDRLPGRPRRLVGPRGCRRPPRPHDLRQGHGRRLPRRGLRRSPRRHGPAGPRRARLPGGHAVGQPRRHRRRARDAAGLRRRALRAPR